MMKLICNKPTINILYGEKLKIFPLRLRTSQGFSVLPFLFNILEVLARSIRQEKEKKSHPNQRSKIFPTYRWYGLHKGNPKELKKKKC